MRHRGPDWSGLHCFQDCYLAHQRLAIVDPTSGDQPLYNEDKSIVVTVCDFVQPFNLLLFAIQPFNTEIYPFHHLTTDFHNLAYLNAFVNYWQFGIVLVSQFRIWDQTLLKSHGIGWFQLVIDEDKLKISQEWSTNQLDI